MFWINGPREHDDEATFRVWPETQCEFAGLGSDPESGATLIAMVRDGKVYAHVFLTDERAGIFARQILALLAGKN